MLIKNQKIKKSEIGSDITIHRRGKSNGLTILPNTYDQIPKSPSLLRANPGGLFILF